MVERDPTSTVFQTCGSPTHDLRAPDLVTASSGGEGGVLSAVERGDASVELLAFKELSRGILKIGNKAVIAVG